MKKIFMALVAVSMIFVSCGKKMSPEATKAWENVKTTFAAVGSMEAVDQFESVDDWNVAVQAFNTAVQEMAKYEQEFPKAVVDSFTNMTTQFAETQKQAVEKIQQSIQEGFEEGIEEGLEEGEEELEEMEEEE